MASKIKKVPFPDWLARHKCTVELDGKGIDENGERKKENKINSECIYSDCAKNIYDKDGKRTVISGTVMIKGDIAPDMPLISSGSVTVGEQRFKIHSAARGKNPDGSVHHTELYLI